MAVVIDSVAPVIGTHPEFLPFSFIDQVGPLTIVAELTSTWSVALIKTSIALMLMRLQRTSSWARFLYIVIGVQIATAAFVTIMQTTRCIPLEGLWKPAITDKRCWGEAPFKVGMTVASVLVIVTDVIFTLIPLSFLHNVRRSLRDRVIIGFLMSLGLLASAAAIVKALMVGRFDETDDASGHGLSIALWASIEAQVGIMAACIPCLRGAFLSLLSRAGLVTQVSSGAAGDGLGKPSRPSQGNQRTGTAASRGATRNHGGFDGPRTSTRIVANDSDEDALMPSSGRGVRVERKTEIDIELASVESTK